jgi:hypothetical protein
MQQRHEFWVFVDLISVGAYLFVMGVVSKQFPIVLVLAAAARCYVYEVLIRDKGLRVDKTGISKSTF